MKKIILLSIILSIFFGIFLGSRLLNVPDEGRYAEVSREMLVSGDYITPHVNGIVFLDKPPLSYWLQAGAIKMLGLNNWALRLPSALFGVLGCLLVYIAIRKFYGQRTALVAAGLLATTPLYFGLAHYINMDLQVAVWISAALLFFLLSTEVKSRQKKYLLWAAYVAAGGGVLTKGLIGIVLPMTIIGSWILLLNRWYLLKSMQIPMGIAIILIINLPWFLAVQHANPQFNHYFFVFQQFTRFAGVGFNGTAAGWFYLPIIILGFFPWIIFFIVGFIKQLAVYWRTPQIYAKELFFLIWIAVVGVFFSVPNSKLVSYILPIFPPLAMLTAVYITINSDKIFSSNYVKISLLLSCAVLAAVFFYVGWYFPIIDTFSITPIKTYLFSVAVFLLMGGVAAYRSMRLGINYVVTILMAMMLAIFISLLMGAKYVNINSTLPLINIIKPELSRQDSVVAYNNFYQDLPLYLERHIVTVANWDNPDLKNQDNALGQLAWGMQYHPAACQWMLNPAQFWQHWHAKQKMWVFLSQKELARFNQTSQITVHKIATNSNIVVVSNR